MNTAKTHNCASYLGDSIPRRAADKTLRHAIDVLTLRHNVVFDTFAFRGVSGFLIGPVLAHLMQKEIIIVRKSSEGCVSGEQVEGYLEASRYVIVDDLISTMSTVVRIIRGVKHKMPQARCVGILLYFNGCKFYGLSNPRYEEAVLSAQNPNFFCFR